MLSGRPLYFHAVVSVFYLSSSIFFSSPNLSGRRLNVYHTSTHSANLECRSETCCARLSANTGHKKVAINRHLRSIAQLCRIISSQLRHILTIGKKLVKQQYLLHMSPQYGELRPTSGWDRSGSLGHPCKFQRVSRLGIVTARHCSSSLQCWTEGATYIRQGGHHVGHWPTFVVRVIFLLLWFIGYFRLWMQVQCSALLLLVHVLLCLAWWVYSKNCAVSWFFLS